MTSFLNSIIEIHKIFEFQKKIAEIWLVNCEKDRETSRNEQRYNDTYIYIHVLPVFICTRFIPWTMDIINIKTYIARKKKLCKKAFAWDVDTNYRGWLGQKLRMKYLHRN